MTFFTAKISLSKTYSIQYTLFSLLWPTFLSIFQLSTPKLSLKYVVSFENPNLLPASSPTNTPNQSLSSLLVLSNYHFIHSSLTNGIVHSSLKTAAMTPVTKKPGADPNNPVNKKPISNLPFLSKIPGRAVAELVHTESRVEDSNLFKELTSGFRPLHNTDRALVKISNDLLMTVDSGLLTVLILLHLSATFDPILYNHKNKKHLHRHLPSYCRCSSGLCFGSSPPDYLLLPPGHIFRNSVFTSTATLTTPCSVCPPSQTPPFHRLPSLTVSWKLRPGSLETFPNSAAIESRLFLLWLRFCHVLTAVSKVSNLLLWLVSLRSQRDWNISRLPHIHATVVKTMLLFVGSSSMFCT